MSKSISELQLKRTYKEYFMLVKCGSFLGFSGVLIAWIENEKIVERHVKVNTRGDKGTTIFWYGFFGCQHTLNNMNVLDSLLVFDDIEQRNIQQ